MGTIKLMDSEQELNRRRAEWAGINLVGVPEGCEPNFSQSLDACFKWLVPKLTDLAIYKTFGEFTARVWGRGDVTPWTGQSKEVALALCKAIDKLIDSEKKDEGNKNETH